MDHPASKPDTAKQAPALTSKQRKLHEYLADDPMFVKIIVGPERKTWTVMEDFICDNSEYFRKAFKGGFKEATTKQIEFPEDRPQDFAKIIEFLSVGTISGCERCKLGFGQVKSHQDPPHELDWCYLWVLADKLQLSHPNFPKGIAFAKLHDCYSRSILIPSADAITYVSENAPLDSTLATFYLDQLTRCFFDKTKVDLISKLGEAATTNATFNGRFLKRLSEQVHQRLSGCKLPGCYLHAEPVPRATENVRETRFTFGRGAGTKPFDFGLNGLSLENNCAPL